MRASGWALAAALVVLGASCQAPRSEVRAAPAFELPDLAGGKVKLSDLKGKVVVLDFWATWCGPCIKEIPDYAEFWKKNRPRGVEVVGVVCDSGEPDEIQDFVREYRIPYRQLLGDEEVQAAFGALQGFPTTFVIDGQGVIRKKMLGSPPGKFEALQKLVDDALAAR
jgi:peroxiredoxin